MTKQQVACFAHSTQIAPVKIARPKPTTSAMAVAWRNDGAQVAAGTQDGYIKIWSLGCTDERPLLAKIRDLDLAWDKVLVTCIAWSHTDSNTLATVHGDGKLRFWISLSRNSVPIKVQESGSSARLGSNDESYWYQARWSPDGKHLTAQPYRGDLQVWDVVFKPECVTLLHQRTLGGFHVKAHTWSPDSARIAALVSNRSTGRPEVEICDATNGNPVGVIVVPSGWKDISAIDWNSNGKQLVTCGSGVPVRLWNVEEGSFHDLSWSAAQPQTMASFSPSGKRLATAGKDAVRIWEVGKRTADFRLPGIDIIGLAWSPDSRRIPWRSSDAI